MKSSVQTKLQMLRTLKVQVLIALGFALGLQASLLQAAPPPAGVAPVNNPPGGFGINGSLIANQPVSGVGDWLSLPGVSGSGGGVLDVTGAPLNPLTTFHFVDPYNGNDNNFVGGDKWTDDPNTWQWTMGKAGGKTDINNVLLHIAQDAEGHVWVVIAADRFSTSGDSYIDFEFLQNTVTANANGTFTSAGTDGGRTANDMLLSLAFTSGGSVADFFAWRWEPNGSGGFAYTDVTASLPAGRVFAALNSNTIAVPYGAFGQTTYAPNAFAEAAVDLTALLGNFDQCLSMGFKTILVKTKTSQSSTATISDFINPIQYSLKIGPSANAGPNQTQCWQGDSTAFALNGTATPGLQPIASTTWSVVAGTATIDAANSLTTTAHVFSASATLRLTVIQANGCSETSDVVLSVAPLPVCAISGPTLTCPTSRTTFTGPPGMNSYAWSVSGNAILSGPTTQSSVTVLAGTNCGQDFVLSLTVSSNSCPSTCSSDVMVADTVLPTMTCPADVTLECPANTGTNVTGVPVVQDDCSKTTVSFSDSVSNTCANAKIISRTWTVTDLCGNGTSCVQTITVRDTTPPLIHCPANATLECPADTSPNTTGVATATDGCGAVLIGYSDSVSNSCGGARVIARIWTASDQCGNVSSGVQTITVRDSTPPVITCPANVTLECPAQPTTNVTGVATATDGCGSVSIGFSDSVSNTCAGAEVVKRTWTATDQCGNVSSGVQTITVRDTTPPVITCPANVTVECPAQPTTNVTGVATATDGCGSVTIRYSDSISNTCGGAKVISRTWTATDQCGNVSSGVQAITVRDTTPPVINCPANITLECPAQPTTNVTGVATATDGCGSVSIGFSDSVSNSCSGARVISRTWTASDQCGNVSSGVQTITVRDSTPPVITGPANVTLECPAITTTNNTGVATATDGCSSVTIRYSDSVSNTCGNAKIIYRTWTATDQCGNGSSCVQTITIRDTTPPVITCPSNLTLECGASTAPSATGTATVQDTCSSVTVSYSDSVSNACGNARVISRTWKAIDACGNSASCVQTITVQDMTPPSLTLPQNLTQNCPGDTRTNVTGVATAVDGCGSVTISYSDVVSNGCGMSKIVWRTWTAIDQCGNHTNGVQTITVRDVAPTISCRSLSVQCVGDVPPPYPDLASFLAAGGTASSSCDPSLIFSLTSDSGLVNRCPGRETRVYRVTDDCGLYAECTQTITVDDTIPPVLTCPTNVTVECGTPPLPAITGLATATDNCSTNVIIAYSDAAVQSQYAVKFYAADPGVNTGPYAPTYLKFAPTNLACPTEAVLTGRAADPLRNAVAYGPTGSTLDALTTLNGGDMSLGQIVPYEVVIQASGGPGPERGTIDFTASWSTYTTANERFGFDTNYMVYCAFVDYADQGAIDPNYNAKVESYSAVLTNQGTIDEQIVGTFRVTGLEPGDQVVVEIWVVLDSTPPRSGGTVAAGLISAQKDTVPPQPISIGTQTTGIGNLNKLNPLPSPQPQPPLGSLPTQPTTPAGCLISVFNRTWTASDQCGNVSSGVQTIAVRDTTAPVITCPADVTLECPAQPTTNVTGVATATDGCGSVSIGFSDSVSNTCGGAEVVRRTWRATDQCGNVSSGLQTITVRDTTPPVIAQQPDMTLHVGDSLALTPPSVSDACSDVSVWLRSLTTNAWFGGAYSINCTWEAMDGCSNVAQMSRTFWVLPRLSDKPTLAIGKHDRLLSLGWPAEPSGWWLESTRSLSRPHWQPVGITPTLTNGIYLVTLDPTGVAQWFRLASGNPPLSIFRSQPDKLMLAWPSLATGYTVLRTTNLWQGPWSPDTAIILITNGMNYVECAPTNASSFFKLVKPAP